MRLMDPLRYQQFTGSGRLPSPKGVALAIVELLQQDDYAVAELVQLLESDPASAGHILKLANAAGLANSARRVASVSKAVQVVGSNQVRDLVLAFSILDGYRCAACTDFDCELFWARSLFTAIAAHTLASVAHIVAEESFTLGLLADVGKLALATYDCKRYCEALRMADASATPITEVERAVIGADHRELGAALMAEWGLPEAIVVPAYYAEEPDSSGFPDGSRAQAITVVLHFAQSLAGVCVATDAERWTMLPEVYATAARLGIASDELSNLVGDIVARWHDWGRAVGIQTRELQPFADIVASAPPLQHAVVSAPHRRAVIVGVGSAEASRLGIALETMGYAANWIVSGVDGLAVALRDNPDLIVVDVDSADLAGEHFCAAYRASPLAREAYLVLVGNADQETRLGAIADAGADDFLLRPYGDATLQVRLRAADKVQHLRDAICRERRGLLRSADKWAGSQRRLLQVALTDPLTRLPNRRRGLDFLAAEWVYSRNNDLSLSCMMIDLDHFKAINDRWGHDGGDAVLVRVATILADSCRAEDMAFRYGGEEFCVVCTNTELTVARAIAERIRGGIELDHHTHIGTDETITVSIGVAAMSPAFAKAEMLLKAADMALYRAKENGRNRVET